MITARASRAHWRLTAAAVLTMIGANPGLTQDATTETTPAGVEVAAETTTSPLDGLVDDGAKLFLGRCAGCHTVGGGALSGPDLLPASRWTISDLTPAIKRMEAKAGPLSDEEITSLTELLRSGQAQPRLQAQERALAATDAATLEAPVVATGRDLYSGALALQNGGPSCVACHSAGGFGGNLGPDLTKVAERLTETALRAGIEKSNYKVMKPAFEACPVTPQEAAHLTAYLQDVAKQDAAPVRPVPVAAAGFAAAGITLGLLSMVGRRRAAGTRKRLVQEANKR